MGGSATRRAGVFGAGRAATKDGVRVLFWLYAGVPAAAVVVYAAVGLASG
jgi:hypothetical protein